MLVSNIEWKITFKNHLTVSKKNILGEKKEESIREDREPLGRNSHISYDSYVQEVTSQWKHTVHDWED